MKIIPISSDPLQFDAELTEYVTDVKAGGKEIHFDVKEPSTHFLYAELAALKAPIRLEFISAEKGIQPIVDASPTLITTLLASKKNKLDQMLFGRLREWLSLANIPLEKGKKIDFNLESKGNLPFKGKLIYVITDINDKEIHAHVTYLVERQKAVGDFPIETEEEKVDCIYNNKNGRRRGLDAREQLDFQYRYERDLSIIYHQGQY